MVSHERDLAVAVLERDVARLQLAVTRIKQVLLDIVAASNFSTDARREMLDRLERAVVVDD